MPTTISPEARARRIETASLIAKTPSAFTARYIYGAIADLLEIVEADAASMCWVATQPAVYLAQQDGGIWFAYSYVREGDRIQPSTYGTGRDPHTALAELRNRLAGR